MPDKEQPKRVSNGYKADRHSVLPYVDKQYKELLDKLAEKNGRNKKRQAEITIEQDFINTFGYEEYRAIKDAYDIETVAKAEGVA